ncbi:protein phosphatase 2C domain-containing protein [Rhodoblastus acidophilus]|uniref:Protein phosphatase 2C domain-containing protein n=1 Tax=Candidatus Rhodoblastus alkanivorans TaxID=2954117 RepID=A0ABS9Z234_9HYPH|nr:protein phosphatase 2C domain-containing protein [Candidatus Rhodoblastus alkanivorans]MCI4679016.1 protein phosphatase 2C domain-containing protein [Candidatus Rhodoblastus alkanivorans]MCI4681729.1 protein phosphatase 2C domain-containing protein [Candidatus Rhodoblastus alkanivorans]MDI4642778.1 protein phosphatase 2C domain-containing protein [Rhodoblastus acidophilus]
MTAPVARVPAPRLAYGLVSARGRRPSNQDFAACCRDPLGGRRGFAAAVADGLGGHRGGREAAETAVRAFLDGYFGAAPHLSPLAAASRALDAVNGWIAAIGRRDPRLARMATTFTAVLVADGRGHVLHVGDSRAYRLSGGRLDQITSDHVVDLGEPTLRLRRAIGFDVRVHLDHVALDLAPRDRLLLCTDGLHGALSARRIAALLAAAPSPLQAARTLRDGALAAGAADNVTLVVLDVLEPAPDFRSDAAAAAPVGG